MSSIVFNKLQNFLMVSESLAVFVFFVSVFDLKVTNTLYFIVSVEDISDVVEVQDQ
jgi:hypothetical protein